VHALGLGECLVGRSHECDHPAEVLALPVVTRTRVTRAGDSGAIDNEVKGLLREGLSIYEIDLEALRELRPTVVLTQAQCEVCAVTLTEVEAALGEWTERKPRLISVSPARLTDVWSDIVRVATALGVESRGRELVKVLKTRVVDVVERTCVVRRHPTVACIEWLDPLMAAGNWVPELVELSGGRPLFGEAGKHSPWLEWEALAKANPDVIVVMPCGFDLERTEAELPALSLREGWRRLRAVKEERVYLADGSRYFNRPGPRLVDSLEMLVRMVHPGLFSSKGRRQGWRKL
jgi:iron complex transport system substrate-binding protein